MGLFDRLQEGVVKGLSQTERALELSRLKSQMDHVGRQRDEAITGLGRAVYRAHRENRFSGSEFGAAIEQIREMEIALGKLEGQVEALRTQAHRHTCASCGTLSASDAKFCIGCGRAVEHIETRPCPACGAAIGLDVVFCGRCGTEVGLPDAAMAPESVEDRSVPPTPDDGLEPEPGSVLAETDSDPSLVPDTAASAGPEQGLTCTSCGHLGELGERFCGSCGSAMVS